METTAPALWKDLKTNFSNLSESELRAALCRAQHYQVKDVDNLRPVETKVKEWMDAHNVKAGTMYRHACNKKKTNYAERYGERRIEEKWRRLIDIKNKLHEVLPEKTPEEIRRTVRRISRYDYGEVQQLTKEERLVHDVILKLDIKPATLHLWLIKTVVPDEVKERLDKGLIAVSTAKRLLVNREHQRKAAIGVQLLEDARKLVKEVLE